MSTLPRIFVSHSKRDADWCYQLVQALQAVGLDVWIDDKGLSGGAVWVATIQQELQAREMFLVVLTHAAWDSEWVQEEIQLALAQRRQIVPVMYKRTEVEGFLLNRQWIDVQNLDAAAAARRILGELKLPVPVNHGISAPDRAPVRLDAPFAYRGHNQSVLELAWSPYGDRVASASMDGTVQVWRPGDDGKPIVTYTRHHGRVNTVAWSPDGSRIASGGSDGTVQIWDADNGQHTLTYIHTSMLPGGDHQSKASVHKVAWSSDGGQLTSAGEANELDGQIDSPIRVWDASSGKIVLLLRSGGYVATTRTHLSWSPDNARIASNCLEDKTSKGISIWNLKTGGVATTLDKGNQLGFGGVGDRLRCLAWSPDGRWLAASTTETQVKLWNGTGGTRPLYVLNVSSVFSWSTPNPQSLAWSPDSTHICVGMSVTGKVQVWRVDTQPRMVFTYAGHPVAGDRSPNISSVAWSPKSSLIASACSNGTVHVWPVR